MSYFIFNQTKPVNIFKCGRRFPDKDYGPLFEGDCYQDTKNHSLKVIGDLIDQNIATAIANNVLPEMGYKVEFTEHQHRPLCKVIVHDIKQPIVYRKITECPDFQDNGDGYYCEVWPPVELNELGNYVHDTIMQIIWKYNCDILGTDGLPKTRFLLQIKFLPELMARQLKKFDQAFTKLYQRRVANESTHTL